MTQKPPSLYRHPKRKKRIRRPEQELQIAIFNFLKPLMQIQKYKQFCAFHVPNGGQRTKYEGMIFKAMGVMPGVPDICLLLPYNEDDPDSYPRTVWIELKAGKGDTTDNQDAFGALMEEYGFDYRVLAASDKQDAVDQMRAILREYGVNC